MTRSPSPPRLEPRFTLLLVSLCVLLIGQPDVPLAAQSTTLRVTFLDVGQGDAIVIQAPGDRTALIDAGPGASVVPMLQQLGVERLDLVVATHPHADHIGGMLDVIESMPVRFFLDNGGPHPTATYARLLDALTRHAEITYLEAVPRTIALGDVTIEVLPLPPSAELNDQSVALVVRYGDFTAFLSGDSERAELTYLTRMGDVPDVTLLKAPHHGSDNGFTPDFLATARPEVVVISVGDNSYGHPGAEALSAYASVAHRVLRTDMGGSITVLGHEDGRFEVTAASMLAGGGRRPTPTPTEGAPSSTSSSEALAITLFADAPGNDHQNTNGEYAVISNRGSSDVEISSWRLCDAARHCFRFPADARVPASGQVVVFTGMGSSDGTRFFMGSRQAVWNNDGDVATLYDAAGAVIVRYRYD